MKSEEEKKTRRVPTRMTQGEYQVIREKAKSRKMSVSAYVVDSAVHSDNHLDLPTLIRIQNLANMAADACEKLNLGIAAEIREEVSALWQSF